MNYASRLTELRARIHEASVRLKRDPGSILLIAVSKLKPSDAVRQVWEANQLDFGENYVQELVEKASSLPSSIRWHMIGELQSNKVRKLVRSVPNLASIQSLHSSKIASVVQKELSLREGDDREKPLDVYIEVCTSSEGTKSGCKASQLKELVDHIRSECRLCNLVGLMTVPDPAEPSRCFQELKHLADLYGLPKLSMGMSSDWEEALACGATTLRIGSDIFGSR